MSNYNMRKSWSEEVEDLLNGLYVIGIKHCVFSFKCRAEYD